MTTTYPPDPLTLQVIDRIVTVLKGIVGGADYFYTVGENVIKGAKHYQEVTSFPFDMVSAETEDRKPEYLPDNLVRKYMAVSVKAYVDAEGGEPVTKLLKHLRDVQKAINEDSRSGTAGALGAIADFTEIETVETDNGMLALEGYGYFDQRVVVCITGNWGTL